MKKLERRLGLGSVVAISISAMLGSGIFVLPGIAVSETGRSIWLAYLFAGLCVLPAALSKSELATAMPTTGGAYIYLERTFGPLVGTVTGLGLGMSLLFKAAFALVGFGAYLSVIADVPLRFTALVLLVVIVLLNVVGVGTVTGALIAIVLVNLASLAAISVWGAAQPFAQDLTPFLSNGSDGLITAAAVVFISYAGVTKVAAIGGEIRDPEKNLPKGILISLGIVGTVYCLVSYVMVERLSVEVLSGNLRPVYRLALEVGGSTIGIVAAGIGVLAMMSMANAGMLAASRFPFAMSRDQLLPRSFGKLHQKFLTPTYSIFASGIIVALIIGFIDTKLIAKMASAFIIISFVAVNFAVIVLREKRVQWYRPTYKSPFYPWVQIAGIILCCLLLFKLGMITVLAIATIGIPGVVLYITYGRQRTTRKGVLGIRSKRAHLVEPIPARHIPEIDFGEDASVVVSLFGDERSPEMMVELGSALAHGRNIEVVYMTELPEQTDLDDISEDSPEIVSVQRRLTAMAEAEKLDVKFDPIVSHDIYESVAEITQRLHCEWFVKAWQGRSREGFTFHNPIGWLKDHLSCNLAILADKGIRYIRKIMVYVEPGPDDRLVLETANHLAKVFEAQITLVRFVHTKNIDSDKLKEQNYLSGLAADCIGTVRTEVYSGVDEVETLVSYTVEYDMLVMGGDRSIRWFSNIRGSKHDLIAQKATCSVVTLQAKRLFTTNLEI